MKHKIHQIHQHRPLIIGLTQAELTLGVSNPIFGRDGTRRACAGQCFFPLLLLYFSLHSTRLGAPRDLFISGPLVLNLDQTERTNGRTENRLPIDRPDRNRAINPISYSKTEPAKDRRPRTAASYPSARCTQVRWNRYVWRGSDCGCFVYVCGPPVSMRHTMRDSWAGQARSSMSVTSPPYGRAFQILQTAKWSSMQ